MAKYSKLPMALKQGFADGQENPVSVIYSFKIYETQKYLAMTGHTCNSMVHVMSKKTWDKLTPKQQMIVREESKKADDFMRRTLRLTVLAKDWTPVFNVSRRYLFVCMPISGVIMVGYSIRNIVREMLAFWQMENCDKGGKPPTI